MGSLGKKLSRGSLHLLGSNLTVLPQSGGVGVGALLFSVWAEPVQHKSTTSDWAVKEVPITVTWFDVKEPSTSIIGEQTGPKNDSASSAYKRVGASCNVLHTYSSNTALASK